MRRIVLPVTMMAAVCLAACQSYKPLTLPSPGSAVGKAARVQYAAPRSVTAARDAGGDSVLRFVSRLEGQVIEVRGDTMTISVARIIDGTGSHPAPAGMRVGVTPDPSIAVDVRDLDGGKTAALAGGGLIVLSVIAVAALVAALGAVY